MENSGVRDNLAVERTRLANERTLLAYIRTALSLLAGGAVLFQFYSDRPTHLLIAWLLVTGGGIVILVGVARFLHVRSRLNSKI